MTQYVDISFTRAWRLTVVKSESQEEQLVSDDELADIIHAVTSQAAVQRVHCEPVMTAATVQPVRAYNFAFYAEQPDETGSIQRNAA